MRLDIGVADRIVLRVDGAEYLSNKELGVVGEQLAVEWLTGRGWRLLGTNVQVGHCEIDAIYDHCCDRENSAKTVRVLSVVEVKTRRRQSCGSGADGISQAKVKNLRRAAARWLDEHNYHCDEVRFDVVECSAISVTELELTLREDAF